MKYCQHCGNSLPDDAKFCNHCGKPVGGTADNTDSASSQGSEEGRETFVSDSSEHKDTTAETSSDAVHRQSASEAKTEQSAFGQEDSASRQQESQGGGQQAGGASPQFSFNAEEASEKVKGLLTDKNLKLLVMAALVMPALSYVLLFILNFIFGIFFGIFGIAFALSGFGFLIGNIFNLLYTVVRAACFLITLGGIAAVLFMLLKDQRKQNMNGFILLGGTVLAFLCCLGFGTHGLGRFFVWILSLGCAFLAVDLFSRVMVQKKEIDSEIKPDADMKEVRDFLKKSREDGATKADESGNGAENSSAGSASTALEGRNMELKRDKGDSYFDGTGLENLGYTVLMGIGSFISCGLAFPWLRCWYQKWKMQHTVIEGNRLDFDGTGMQMFGLYIKWLLLTMITCGIYGFFVYVDLRKWELRHTFLYGEVPELNLDNRNTYFDGNSFEFIGYQILTSILTSVTCGIAFPFAAVMLEKWNAKSTVLKGHRLRFTGTAGSFFGTFLIIWALTLITCGIYGSWGQVRWMNWILKNTEIED